MKARNLLTATGTWAILLVPAVAAAQDDDGGFMLEEGPSAPAEPLFASELEVGVGYNFEDSFKFGEYTGLTESDPFLILNFDILNRDEWDSGNTEYFRLRGENLGLDSRNVEGEVGDQGRYAAGLRYREIPHNLIDDALIPYNGAGGTTLTLPPGWVAAPGTAGLTSLGSALRTFDIENERKQLNGFLSLLPGEGWTLDFDLGREERDGTKPTYAAFGTNGGNPSIVALPKPVEWSVNDVEATLGYAGRKFQFELGYHGSFFENDNNVVIFQNPYSQQFSGGPWAAGAGYPGSGGFGLEPDNEAHQVLFSGGYTLGEASRISGQLSYSMLEQDDQFLPYSVNPSLNANQPLPRQSLDGDLDVLVADLAYTNRLRPTTDLRARLRYEDQDNSTPQNIYVRIAGDAQNQPAGIANSNARINLPYSFEKTKFDVELNERLSPRSKLGVEYEFEDFSRTFSEVDSTTEHTVGVKLRQRFSDMVHGRFIYRHGERDGDDPYQGNAPFLAGNTAAFLATEAPEDQFENHPEIRKYNLADRSLDELKAMLTLSSTPQTSWTFHASWLNEDFDDTSLGLTEREMVRAALDWNYAASETVLFHAFYSFEQFDDNLDGHQFTPFPPTNSLTDPKQRWMRDGRDRIHSLGFGAVWTAMQNKLDIELDYVASLAETDYTFSGGSDLGDIEDAPTLSSDLHRVDLTADWKLAEDRSLRLTYIFEYFNADDFTLDGVGVTSNPRMLTFGQESPDYTANVVGVSYVAKW